MLEEEGSGAILVEGGLSIWSRMWERWLDLHKMFGGLGMGRRCML